MCLQDLKLRISTTFKCFAWAFIDDDDKSAALYRVFDQWIALNLENIGKVRGDTSTSPVIAKSALELAEKGQMMSVRCCCDAWVLFFPISKFSGVAKAIL